MRVGEYLDAVGVVVDAESQGPEGFGAGVGGGVAAGVDVNDINGAVGQEHGVGVAINGGVNGVAVAFGGAVPGAAVVRTEDDAQIAGLIGAVEAGQHAVGHHEQVRIEEFNAERDGFGPSATLVV